jgi:hypothetical protein
VALDAVVPTYSGGTATEFHRFPYSPGAITNRTGTCISGALYPKKEKKQTFDGCTIITEEPLFLDIFRRLGPGRFSFGPALGLFAACLLDCFD